MAGRPPKPLALMTKNLTKEEIQIRTEQEEKLKGKDDKVYKAPKGIPKEVAKIYKTIVNESNFLNNLDIELITTTAYAIFRMKEAREKIDRDGVVLEVFKPIEKDGEVVDKVLVSAMKHPAVAVEKDYQAIFHTGCIQLGLSPSSRTKLTLINIESNKKETLEDKVFG